MKGLDQTKLEAYLKSLLGRDVQVFSIEPLGKKEDSDLKSYGYGVPYLIHCKTKDGEKRLVIETMSANHFGHEFASDRAGILLWSHSAYNSLPNHVRSLDAGAFSDSGDIISVGRAEEFFLLTEFAEGNVYAADLQRIAKDTKLLKLDPERAKVLASYLVKIHSMKASDPPLYKRRIRELLGHGECIMGLIDNYPANDPVATLQRLRRIEQSCVDWRWKIKNKDWRLCQVHGDFHPWNILFREGIDFVALDRSRGTWGEAADDVSSMMMNYIFYSLQSYGRLKDPFEELINLFWETYLNGSDDEEIRTVLQPFLAWRALVIGNPIWYPSLSPSIREKLFYFIETVLQLEVFNPAKINEYLGVS